MNIYEKILKAREEFLQEKIKKSGRNNFQKFDYFELEDIVPPALKICAGLKILPLFNITKDTATLKIVDVENIKETVTFTSLIPDLGTENVNMAIQNIGKIQTYQRRYLYMQFLDIVEADAVDAGEPAKAKKSVPKPAPKKQSKAPKAPAPPKNPGIKEKKGGKPSGKAKAEPTLPAETVEKIFKKCPKLQKEFKDIVDFEDTIPEMTMLRRADALLQDKEIPQEQFNEVKKLI